MPCVQVGGEIHSNYTATLFLDTIRQGKDHAKKLLKCVLVRAGVRWRWKCAVVDCVVFTHTVGH